MNSTERIAEIREQCDYQESIGNAHIDCVEIAEIRALLFEIDRLTAELERCTTGNGTYISMECHNRKLAELEQKTRELERYREAKGWPQWKIDAYDALFTIPAASKEKLVREAALSAEGVSG